MTALVIAIVVVVAIALVVAFALASVALRADRNDPETTVLTLLGRVRSPSGRPFFASSAAREEFAATLEQARDDARATSSVASPSRSRAPRRARRRSHRRS